MHRFNLIKMDRYNTHDSDSSDWNKLDIIQPVPKRLCNRSPKDCTYGTCNAPHISPAPSDWSGQDWDGDKANVREQRSLIDIKLVDAQVQDTTWETMLDRQEKELVNGVDNLMLDQDKTALTDTLAPPPDTTEEECKVEGTKDDNKTLMYNMTEQERRLQCEEEKFDIYISTFSYEGDDLDLDMD